MSFFFRLPVQTTEIDTILEKEDFELEELLDASSLVENLRDGYAPLVDYFADEVVLGELLDFILVAAPPDADPKYRLKYPKVAADIIGSSATSIVACFKEGTLLFTKVASFLDGTVVTEGGPLVDHWCSIVGELLSNKDVNVNFLSYMRDKNPDMLGKVVGLARLDPMRDLVFRIVVAAQETSYLPWLTEVGLTGKIVNLLAPKESADTHENAHRLLAVILGSPSVVGTSLGLQLFHASTVETLVKFTLDDPDASVDGALAVLIALIESMFNLYLPELEEANAAAAAAAASYDPESGESAPLQPHLSPFITTVLTILDFLSGQLPALVALSEAQPKGPATTVGDDLQHSALTRPCGALRIKIAHFLSAVTRFSCLEIEVELVKLGVVAKFMDFMIAYKWNNNLHYPLTHVVVRLLNSSTASVRAHVLDEAALVSRVLAAVAANHSLMSTSHMRAGYMGHLLQIANALAALGPVHPSLESPEWLAFVEGELAATNVIHTKIIAEDYVPPSGALLGGGPAGSLHGGGGGGTGGGLGLGGQPPPASSMTDLFLMLHQVLGIETGGTVNNIFGAQEDLSSVEAAVSVTPPADVPLDMVDGRDAPL